MRHRDIGGHQCECDRRRCNTARVTLRDAGALLSRHALPTPARAVRLATVVRRHGLTFATLGVLAAQRDPDGIALTDDDGDLSYAALERRARLAAYILHSGGHLRAGQRLGVLCRNGRGFVIAVIAGSLIGADLVLLDPESPAPGLAQVLGAERVDVLLHDDDLSEVVADARPVMPAMAVESLYRDQSWASSRVPRPPRPGGVILLTSGTTGQATGARRDRIRVNQFLPVATLLTRIPLTGQAPMAILPPVRHGFGLVFLALALAIGAPVVVHKRFDPSATAGLIEDHGVDTVIAVPPILARLAREIRVPPARPVRAIVSGAGLLHPSVCRDVIAAFGPVLHNLYGSTEDGWSTLATPDDLRTAPGTIGRPVAGIRVQVLDDDGRPLPAGSIGRLCVSSRLSFDGYTSGRLRPRLGGLIDTGDLGYEDDGGLFYVVGRADEMIVTGGENVFPAEIEDVLLLHPGVADVRVDGVPDDEYGARLVAHVVRMEAATVTTAQLQTHVETRLGRHKIPREMHFVDALPKTAVGKNTRRAPEPGGWG